MRLHLKNVYACLTISMLAAAVGSYIDIFTNLFSGGLLTLICSLGFLIALRCTVDDGKNRKMRLLFLVGFSFCSGLNLGSLLEQVIEINPSIIPTAFFSTCLVFVSFSLSAMLAKRGSWLFLGGLISTAFMVLFFTTLAGILFRSPIMYQTHLYIGLFIMCAFVLYDTQLIMEKRRLGDKDFIGHSVELFIDFIGIFRRLMIILAQKVKIEQFS
ncbi:hypothetical protein AAG570_000011 [Ranatra chinensis]|uniref:Bax inhibitor 1 n=1 Tax=Ranatra chinensis TaxID=642074 RepID=A0ABD0YVU0_9HEMI